MNCDLCVPSPITPASEPGEARAAVPARRLDSPRSQEWIRRHISDIRNQYNAWITDVQNGRTAIAASAPSRSGNPLVRKQHYLKELDRRAWLHCSTGSVLNAALVPADARDSRPLASSEWTEFFRRCFFIGCSQEQGLELRRRARSIGEQWP